MFLIQCVKHLMIRDDTSYFNEILSHFRVVYCSFPLLITHKKKQINYKKCELCNNCYRTHDMLDQ